VANPESDIVGRSSNDNIDEIEALMVKSMPEEEVKKLLFFMFIDQH